MLDFNTVKVGDQVGIARYGSWGTMSEGIYTIVKLDKIKVIVKRGDLERQFSVKTGKEKSKVGYRDCFLETVFAQDHREACKRHTQDVNAAWKAIEAAAVNRCAKELIEAVAQLEDLIGGLA